MTAPSDRPATVVLVWPENLAARSPGAPDGGLRVRSTGRWLVSTESATHLIDLDRAVATRFPGHISADEVRIAALRRDGEDIDLLAVVAAVGRPTLLLLALAGSGVITRRTTTTTRAIEPAPGVPDDPTAAQTKRAAPRGDQR